ncbi:Serine/threonine protein kinase [[Synechococcus] sp. NIES-970]|nr:Serine/threonine protein kinase [[Synechococcus] sp. NIES-970]
MEILCTRPGCHHPQNQFSDLDDPTQLKTAQQKYCTSCGMHLILGGRYLPQKLLGQGGFGTAFLARDRYTPTMRLCVVKQFQPMGNLDDQQLALAQELFEREAHVLERIGNRHPQIPDLFAFFPLIVPKSQGQGTDQYFYLVQEYIEGQDLEQELAARGKLPETEVRAIFESMLQVLAFVHDQGTIHRDIKPSNIMRHVDGTLYLLDFGAVKEVAAGAGGTSMSQRSTGIYSPGYAPPEQMRGAQVYPATDLYALAVTCVVLLTGETPEALFDGYQNKWLWRKFIQKIEPRFGALLDLMLEPTPGDRPKSAQIALKLLALPSQGQASMQPAAPPTPSAPSASASVLPAQPSPPTALQKPPKSAQKNPAPTQKSSGSVIPLLLGSAFTGFEGILLFMVTGSLLAGNLAIGVWGGAMGLIILAIARKILELKEMFILGVITLGAAFFLVKTVEFTTLVIIAVLVGAASVAAIALFTLIYRLLQKIL